MFTNYADVASLAIGLVLPAIVALFTKPSTNSNVKSIAHAILAVATGFAAVRQAHPGDFQWAPAVVAAFLAWLTGTTFYHSLLKKYSWFGWLQNAFVREAEIVLADKPYNDYLTVARSGEQNPDAVAPVTGDVIKGAVKELDQIPAVHNVVQTIADAPAVGQVVKQVIDTTTPPKA
ncbi:hypothetical protein PV336_15930 [Streptomyces sp. MI02-2A]|uniref:hypothetical protein n=1 Tax=Streptomyces sp. MI02-2A TaxID=3028688 RepID=UPI0029B437DC|nr:hypothetical protein [Streptomyces sp. MI02-2A]MDX3260709.1 hypothetical protein [Streptomyces sp. MI02-2A]